MFILQMFPTQGGSQPNPFNLRDPFILPPGQIGGRDGIFNFRPRRRIPIMPPVIEEEEPQAVTNQSNNWYQSTINRLRPTVDFIFGGSRPSRYGTPLGR